MVVMETLVDYREEGKGWKGGDERKGKGGEEGRRGGIRGKEREWEGRGEKGERRRGEEGRIWKRRE